MVYPPRKELVEGRRVTDKEYRNRLWAYISGHLSGTNKESLLLELNDIGRRVDQLDALANKGIHDKVSLSETRRLLLGEVILLYDLLTLAPPPRKSLVPPGKKVLRELLGINAENNANV